MTLALLALITQCGCGRSEVQEANELPNTSKEGPNGGDKPASGEPPRQNADASPVRLGDVVSRVARGPDDNPGWMMTSIIRTSRVQTPNRNSAVQMLGYERLMLTIDAYQKGKASWQDTDGSVMETFDVMGLPSIDWADKSALPAWQGPGPKTDPFVHVEKGGLVTRVTLGVTEIAEDLLCSIAFAVIAKEPSTRDQEQFDHLVGQVELYGGKKYQLTTSPLIKADTFVDFWNSEKHKRYTITEWAPNQPEGPGHMTAQNYGPLLFEVIDSEPDYIFLEDQKITLSQRFRDGCRQLCDKVMELRQAQGQSARPSCRAP